jgi:hypothetical protein
MDRRFALVVMCEMFVGVLISIALYRAYVDDIQYLSTAVSDPYFWVIMVVQIVEIWKYHQLCWVFGGGCSFDAKLAGYSAFGSVLTMIGAMSFMIVKGKDYIEHSPEVLWIILSIWAFFIALVYMVKPNTQLDLYSDNWLDIEEVDE